MAPPFALRLLGDELSVVDGLIFVNNALAFHLMHTKSVLVSLVPQPVGIASEGLQGCGQPAVLVCRA